MTLFLNTNGMPLYPDGRTTHLEVAPGDLANRIITVGPKSRLEKLASKFDAESVKFTTSHRGFSTATGTFNGVQISIISIGMGFPMMDFLVREALSVISGPAAIIRFGTCGGISEDVKPGDVMVASGGSGLVIRNPDAFANNYGTAVTTEVVEPYKTFHIAPSCPVLSALVKEEMGKAIGPDNVAEGVNVTADSFYSSQGRIVETFDDRNADVISTIKARYPTAKSLEMESFTLLHLAKCHTTPVYATSSTIILSNRFNGIVVDPETVTRHEVDGGRALLEAISKFTF